MCTTPPASSIAGTVFYDANTDLVQESGEPGISGVTITLTGIDTNGNPVNLTTTTNALGNYSFNGLQVSNSPVTPSPRRSRAGYVHEGQVAGSTGGTHRQLTSSRPSCPRTPAASTTTSPRSSRMGRISITKSANVAFVQAGQPVTYTYVVTNTSSVTLTNVIVTDDGGIPNNPNPITVGTISSLAAGASQPFTKTITAPTTPPPGATTNLSEVINGQTVPIGTLTTTILPSGDVQVVFNQSLGIVDNTYGTNASSGWGTQGHKFSDLLGSDQADFQFFAGRATPVLDFLADYVSASSSLPVGLWHSRNQRRRRQTEFRHRLLGQERRHDHHRRPEPVLGLLRLHDQLASAEQPARRELEQRRRLHRCHQQVGVRSAGFGGVSIAYVHDSPSEIQGTIKFTPSTSDFELTNTATVTATTPTNVTVKATAQATVDDYPSGGTPSAPDVTVKKVADNAVITAGGTAGYTVTVTNAGVSTATGVSFTDPLPGGDINWTIASQNNAGAFTISGSPGSQLLVFTPTTLSPGASDIVDVTGTTTAQRYRRPDQHGRGHRRQRAERLPECAGIGDDHGPGGARVDHHQDGQHEYRLGRLAGHLHLRRDEYQHHDGNQRGCHRR